jgi:sialidase-1
MTRRFVCFAMILLICSSLEASGLKKIKDIIIYQDKSYYSTFPSLVLRKDGELLCAFRRAPDRRALWGASGYTHTDPNSYLMLVRSKDGGQTWTKEPELIFAHPLGGSQDPCMVQLKDGSIVCTSYGWTLVPGEGLDKLKEIPSHGAFRFLGGYILRSDDGAKSWKGPFLPIPLPGDTTKDALGRPCPSFNRGAMCQGKDGRLYWAVAGKDQGGAKVTSVHLLISSDRGETWTYSCPIAKDDKITFNETSVIQTAKGDFVAFLRTDGFDGKLAFARSTDGGKSFQPWQDGGFFGHPFHATHLKDGRILLVYGYRKAPFGIRAKILNAECTDITAAPEFVLREDGGSGDIGYPWCVQLPDGKVLVAYYFNLKDGTRHIAGSLLEVE